MKKLLAGMLALMLALSMVACGDNSSTTTTAAPETKTTTAAENKTDATTEAAPKETYTLKFAHEMAEGTPEAVAAENFAKNVYDKTGGAVTIEVFPNGQLGTPATAIESATLGNIDIVSCASGNFARYSVIFNMDTVPYLYSSGEAYSQILKESGALEDQKDVLLENGFVMLNEARNCFRGPYRVLVSTKEIKSIDDISGLRLRAFENTNYIGAYTILGANTIVVAWSETFMALQNGMVDAAACAIGSLKKESFTEVAPYVANVNEYLSSIIMVGTSAAMEKLPAEYVEIIKECADIYGDDVTELMNANVDADIAEMKAKGATFIDIDTAPARELLKDFYYSLEQNGTLPVGTVDAALAH